MSLIFAETGAVAAKIGLQLDDFVDLLGKDIGPDAGKWRRVLYYIAVIFLKLAEISIASSAPYPCIPHAWSLPLGASFALASFLLPRFFISRRCVVRILGLIGA